MKKKEGRSIESSEHREEAASWRQNRIEYSMSRAVCCSEKKKNGFMAQTRRALRQLRFLADCNTWLILISSTPLHRKDTYQKYQVECEKRILDALHSAFNHGHLASSDSEDPYTRIGIQSHLCLKVVQRQCCSSPSASCRFYTPYTLHFFSGPLFSSIQVYKGAFSTWIMAWKEEATCHSRLLLALHIRKGKMQTDKKCRKMSHTGDAHCRILPEI